MLPKKPAILTVERDCESLEAANELSNRMGEIEVGGMTFAKIAYWIDCEKHTGERIVECPATLYVTYQEYNHDIVVSETVSRKSEAEKEDDAPTS